MGTIKDGNGVDLSEAGVIKKRWQEYTVELYKKDLHYPDNHDGVIMNQTWNTLLLLSLQLCLTLCDPIDSSPPGSPVPEILQARTLEWVAISFSSA